MKTAIGLALVLLMSFPVAAEAQARRRTAAKKPAAAPATSPAVREAAVRIAGVAKTLSNFLYVYGGVVKGIEEMNKTASGGSVPAATAARINQNKTAVVNNIRNLQEGLRTMETDFRADPNLKVYSRYVNGLSDDVGLAADAAAADRFDDGGKRLVDVVGLLMDALVPQP